MTAAGGASLLRAAATTLLTTLGLWVVPLTGAVAMPAPLPAGAATGSSQNALIYQVACPAAGSCVGVGAYSDAGNHNQALVDAQTGGVWSAVGISDASLPNAASAPPPQPYLTTVACTSAGNCVAADAYDDSSNNEQGLIVTDSGGFWTPSEAPLGGLTLFANPGVELYLMSCPAAGACVGVGSYVAGNTYAQGLIETQTPFGWSAGEAPVPAGADKTSTPTFYDLSCVGIGSCAAVGYYTDPSGNQQGLLESDSGGTWTAQALDLSGLNPATDPQASLYAVSCAAPGYCSAVGNYVDATGAPQGLLISEVAGVWQPPVKASLPGNASSVGVGSNPAQNDLYLNGIACSSPGNCTAVGSYDATDANNPTGPPDVQALAITQGSGDWAAGVAVSLPSGAAGDPLAALDSVSCRSAAECVAAGTYVDATGQNQALVARQTTDGWSAAGAALSTAYDASAPSGPWASVACAQDGYCAAGGYAFDNVSGLSHAFLVSAPGAPLSPAGSISAGQAIITWGPPGDTGGLPVTGYTVTANDISHPAAGGQKVAVSAMSTRATISGLVPADAYSFTVTAQSLLGIGLPATSAVVPPASSGAPAPPAGAGAAPTGTDTGTGPAAGPVTHPAAQTGSRPPSRARIYASLRGLLRPLGASARRRRVTVVVFRYRALEAGRVSLRWYLLQGRGPHARRRLFASAAVSTPRAGAVAVELHLTSLGQRLLRSDQRLRLHANAAFAPRAGGRVTRTRDFIRSSRG